MKDEVTLFKYYPLEEHYIMCERYLKSRIDWSEISAEIKRNGVSYFNVSDILMLFPHLELDEDYDLICYLGNEYHGIWGRIAAIQDDENIEPVFDAETKAASHFFMGKEFKLPERAVPPMEAIYHDVTALQISEGEGDAAGKIGFVGTAAIYRELTVFDHKSLNIVAVTAVEVQTLSGIGDILFIGARCNHDTLAVLRSIDGLLNGGKAVDTGSDYTTVPLIAVEALCSRGLVFQRGIYKNGFLM